jgi:hypothetical protein
MPSEFRRDGVDCGAHTDLWLAGRRCAVGGRLSGTNWSATWADSSGRIHTGESGPRLDLGARVPELVRGLTAQVTVPAWNPAGGRTAGVGIGVRWRGPAFLLTQAAFERTRVPEVAAFDLYQSPWSVPLNLYSYRYSLDGQARLPAHFALDGSWSHSTYQEAEPRTLEQVHELAPGGTSRQERVTVRWGDDRRTRALARWSHFDLDLRAVASWGGELWGDFSYARAQVHSWLAGLEHRRPGGSRWLLEVESAHAEGKGRASVETWPFTSTAVALLGVTRIYRAQGSADLVRLHAGFERSLGAGVHGQAGVSWYDLDTEGVFESWQPVFLVFGKTDDRCDTLDVTRLQLAAVSLEFRAEWGRTGAGLQLQQFVYAHSTKRPGAPGGPSADDPTARLRRTWPGGTALGFSLRRRF